VLWHLHHVGAWVMRADTRLVLLLIGLTVSGCGGEPDRPGPPPNRTSHPRRQTTESGPGTPISKKPKGDAHSSTTQPPTTLETAGYTVDDRMTAVMATVWIVNPADITEGSGVIVAVRDQRLLVLTADHIIDGGKTVDVLVYTATTYPKPTRVLRDARVIANSATRDLALVRTSNTPIRVAPLAICPLSELPKQSSFWTMTIGCGNGKPPTPLLDHVDASPMVQRPDAKHPVRLWQLHQAQSLGRSGGPMVDQQLRLLGIGSGTSGGHGYYCHLTEIDAFLRDNGFDSLIQSAAPADKTTPK